MTIATKSFADLFTVTRAGTATRVNASGLIETVAANEPRIDYDPVTLQRKGLLIEESRTNYLPDSDLKTGIQVAYFGSGLINAGIASSVIAPDGSSGSRMIAAIEGGDTALRFGDFTSGTPGQIYTGSIWICTADGTSKTVFCDVNDYAQSDASRQFTANGAWQRININGSITDQPYRFFDIVFPAGEFYIWGAQLEAGAFATSYIPTTSGAVTRNADQVSSIMEYVNLAEGTMFISCLPMSYSTSYGLLSLATIGGDYLGIYIGYPSLAISEVWLSPVVHVNLASGGFTAGSRLKAALAYKQNDFAASYNGGAVLTDTSGSVVSSATQFLIGRLAPNNYYFNGWIEDVRYSSKRLTNAELQELTA